ncbi:MAG: hypothetical protein ACOVVK_22540, partial [Elsteraceae bacterium]
MSRLDAAVAETGLFEPAAYAPLRQAMLTRYQGAWRDAPRAPHDPERLLDLAETVGFHLGDWPLCFDLIAQLDAARPSVAGLASPEATLTSMPPEGGEVEGVTLPPGLEPRRLTILRWLKQNQGAFLRVRGDKETMALVNERMKAFVGALRVESEALRHNIRAMHRELEDRDRQIETQREALARGEAQIAALQRRVDHEAASMAQLLNSSSWRLTAPLRAAKRVVRGGKGEA